MDYTKDVGSNVPPERRQMQPSVEWPVATAKLEVEAQKSRHSLLWDLGRSHGEEL
ncbi:MAG: hypothetical protein QMD00_01100 [Hadesarchaea archaeon]|nr:hypothetical protein [Hadesarchaea archaeon]